MFYIVLLIVVAAVAFFMWHPRFKGQRTRVFNIALGLLGGILPILDQITGYLGTLDWTEYVDVKYAPYAVVFVAITGIILRQITTGPVGTKE